MHEDGRGCIFRGKVVLRHPLRNSGSKPYHLSTKTGELQTDGFLVPPKAQQVDLKFPREGIIMN